jgi:hypothetical protein
VASAMTNEQRFIASCEGLGEADVRQKLNAGRYSERRATWASKWLEQVESGKSDATKAEEKRTRLRNSAKTKRFVAPAVLATVVVLVLVVAISILRFR